MADTQQSAFSVDEGPSGIGGWLVLPMFGLILTPVLGLMQMYDADYVGIIHNWRAFSWSQDTLLVMELVIGGILNFTAPALLLLFMFQRWDIFPGWYMIWLTAVPVAALLDALAAYLIFPNSFPTLADAFIPETRTIFRSLLTAVIWIPYMMRSERVANTFVN